MEDQRLIDLLEAGKQIRYKTWLPGNWIKRHGKVHVIDASGLVIHQAWYLNQVYSPLDQTCWEEYKEELHGKHKDKA